MRSSAICDFGKDDIWIGLVDIEQYDSGTPHLFHWNGSQWSEIDIPVQIDDDYCWLDFDHWGKDSGWLYIGDKRFWRKGNTLTYVENPTGWEELYEEECRLSTCANDSFLFCNDEYEERRETFLWNEEKWVGPLTYDPAVPEGLEMGTHSTTDGTCFIEAWHWEIDAYAMYAFEEGKFVSMKPNDLTTNDPLISYYGNNWGDWFLFYDQDETKVRAYKWNSSWVEYDLPGGTSGLNTGYVLETRENDNVLSPLFLCLAKYEEYDNLADTKYYRFTNDSWESFDPGLDIFFSAWGWQRVGDDIWGVGHDNDWHESIVHYDGSSWSLENPTSEAISEIGYMEFYTNENAWLGLWVDGYSDDTKAGGEDIFHFYKYNSGDWAEVSYPSSIDSLWGYKAGEEYFAFGNIENDACAGYDCDAIVRCKDTSCSEIDIPGNLKNYLVDFTIIDN